DQSSVDIGPPQLPLSVEMVRAILSKVEARAAVATKTHDDIVGETLAANFATFDQRACFRQKVFAIVLVASHAKHRNWKVPHAKKMPLPARNRQRHVCIANSTDLSRELLLLVGLGALGRVLVGFLRLVGAFTHVDRIRL